MSIKLVDEEGIKLTLNQQKEIDFSKSHPDVSKDMGTFYNPVMKIHRDIFLVTLKTYFQNYSRKISFCDPMVASGIREARYLKKIPEIFSSLILGDISPSAIENTKNTFDENQIDNSNCVFLQRKAQETLFYKSVDCIEIDPFGSPNPFLDAAISQTHHKGLLCITATDTATLCGVYPKKAKRKYNLDIYKTFCFDDLGLRALIANCQIRAGQFDKELIVKLSFVHAHFYRIFFEVKDSREKSLDSIKNLRFISWDKKTQKIEQFKYNEENRIGPLYIENLKDLEFVNNCLNNIDILEDDTKSKKLLQLIADEVDSIGYYDIHKLQSYCGIKQGLKFEIILSGIQDKGFQASRVHCDLKGLKTNMPHDDLIEFIKNLE